jgi:hypothetical protein
MPDSSTLTAEGRRSISLIDKALCKVDATY